MEKEGEDTGRLPTYLPPAWGLVPLHPGQLHEGAGAAGLLPRPSPGG